ncbi:MAG: AAA family ATPase [Flavobacteriales bacterium]|jgi:nicotinamide riboside kinase
MIRIAITGPECCGKSTLCNWLSERIFDARVVKEYAREYLQKKGAGYCYTKDDVLLIARRTSELLNKAFKSSSDALIVDTDFYVLDIWWRERYGESNEEIAVMKDTYDFDLYLVCQPDLPWETDALRENEQDRERLFALYMEDLFNDGKTVEVVKGTGDARMQEVLEKILRRFPNLMTEE